MAAGSRSRRSMASTARLEGIAKDEEKSKVESLRRDHNVSRCRLPSGILILENDVTGRHVSSCTGHATRGRW